MPNAQEVLDWIKWDKERKANMTNEEWLKSCNTNELAKFLSDETVDAFFRYASGKLPRINGTEAWARWLKGKHE